MFRNGITLVLRTANAVTSRVAAKAPTTVATRALHIDQGVAVQIARAAVCSEAAGVQTFLDRAEVTDRVMAVMKNFEQIDAARVTPTAHFADDLGLDSLDTIEVCLGLEEEFCITIPDEEAEKILTTEDAIHFIATHPQAK